MSVAERGVCCTDCRWWDWAIGCAEDRVVHDPRVARRCRLFAPQGPGGWRAWPARPGAGTPPRFRLIAKA